MHRMGPEPIPCIKRCILVPPLDPMQSKKYAVFNAPKNAVKNAMCKRSLMF